MTWPLGRHEFFVEPDPRRPLFQGDVFRDVPIVKPKSGDRPPHDDPKTSVERRPVILVGYPCDMYNGSDLLRVQSVAVVREASKLHVPPDWGGSYSTCPLPDPFSDGLLWAADLPTTTFVDRAYLAPENRIVALSERGWVYLRQRLALYYTRTLIDAADLGAIGRATWQEEGLWEQWIVRGLDPRAFHAWLGEHDPGLGSTRRRALEDGRVEVLRERIGALERHG
jgi:hypothetical protein